jgi:glycyl-tRNA synthetase beta chain
MTDKNDLLFEIGCEELPPKFLLRFIKDLTQLIQQGLQHAKLTHGAVRYFASPRHLAIMVSDLVVSQPDYIAEKKGPNLANAFNDAGEPAPAALGFARACKVSIEQLERSETGFLIYRYQVSGQTATELLPIICQEACAKLPIPRTMRWGNYSTQFIRPVHWVVLLYGADVIPAEILGCQTDRITYGHRFHHPGKISLKSPGEYESILLDEGRVIVDFSKRKEEIRQQVIALSESINATPILEDDLLSEVTGLVEWPVALCAKFDAEFLKIPPESLMSAMKTHQKSFPLLDKQNNLLPHFITIANIKSENEQEVIVGNQRVMHARLADAAFFYHADCKHRLESRLDNLKLIVFQAKLGTLFDKSQRIASLAEIIARNSNNENLAYRAGLLCKTDLVTDMVKEFPELQGIMGYYYAKHDSEHLSVAQAIREHYLPRFAGDQLPATAVGDAVALADRLDTLIGVFGIQQLPTGDKDPFGLRRAALGVLRILIEHAHPLNLATLLHEACRGYQQPLPNDNVIPQVQQFIIDRLHAWYSDQAISTDTLTAVLEAESGMDIPLDIHRRVLAVHEFKQIPAAKALAVANKRAANILIKTDQSEFFSAKEPWLYVDETLFEQDAECVLYGAIKQLLANDEQRKGAQINYSALLNQLASLREPVDQFFDGVLVMCDDEKLRLNRLALLASVRKLFLKVADISKLQV